MAKIKVRDIKPTGTDLFEDSESFLNEVSSDEIEQTFGGMLAVEDARIIPIKTVVKTTFYTTYTYTYTCLPYTVVIL